MTTAQLNIFVPAIAAIIGAFIGSIASFIPFWLVERYKNKQQTVSIKNALLTEIESMIEIANRRQYLQGLEKVIAVLEQNPEETHKFSVIIPDQYSRIYQSNAQHLGLLDNETASQIVRFHQYVDSVVQDVRPRGILGEGGTYQSFCEAHKMISEALKLGETIVKNR